MSSLLGGVWSPSLLGGVRRRRRIVRRIGGVSRRRRYHGRGLSGVGLSGVGRRRRRVSRVSGSASGRGLRYRVKRGSAIYAAGKRRVHRRKVSGAARGFGRRRVYRHPRMIVGSAYGRGVRRAVSMLNPARLLMNRYRSSGGYMNLMGRMGRVQSRNYGSRLAKPRMRQHRYAHRKSSPGQVAYRNFVRSHIRSAPGATAAARMKHVAMLWRQSH